MYHETIDVWKELLQAGLKEDGWPWDWTTLGALSKRGRQDQKIRARVIAKSEGIWAAEGLVHCLGQISNSKTHPIEANSRLLDGAPLKPNDLVVELAGDATDLLALERPFLNLAAYISGIASATRRWVNLIKHACPNNPPRIALTRKTLPHYRDIAIQGVRIGGGFPHRVSLSGGILIKENHIVAAGGLPHAIDGVRKMAPHGLKIEIEVRSESELKEALSAQVDGVLLDNFTPEQVRSALKILEKQLRRPFVEVSGGLTEGNVSSYALEGVDILSTGSLTHSVQAIDLSLLVYE